MKFWTRGTGYLGVASCCSGGVGAGVGIEGLTAKWRPDYSGVKIYYIAE